MQLEPLEYIVNKHMGDETITITRKALEQWRDHYRALANNSRVDLNHWYYSAKADVLTELLKHFDEGEK